MMNRRTLLKVSLASSAALVTPRLLSASSTRNHGIPEPTAKPKFQMDLCGGRVGIGGDQEQLIGLAQKNGFTAVQPLEWQLKKLEPAKIDELKAKAAEAKLAWSAADFPVEFRKDEQRFKDELKALPKSAKALQHAGVTRIGTWIMPCHENLTYRANFRLHAKRLKEAAKVLEQHGIRLGLEYVGTKSLWTKMRFPFVHTLAETKELVAVIGQPNVGFILDSWHWTMAEESAEDIRKLKNANVVACDLNDAPKDIKLEDQIDNQRELPMATGVIKTKDFLQALIDIQYDGPVRAEPFNKTLNDMDDETAAKTTAEAMKKAFATVEA